ncbi:NAD(P) transhydrogenase subunit alpha [Virgisporangium ochraceum]|uniref:proton-translocating NAD(P)(+) transhydrogenase n=1 Tax=Virgisporangium ochraceum TaxID=65505 RepID=A0A8J3ZWH0_9ACTN|nr:NAD(P) transhydrogenase subunit alpha [Virgisporangium ochraceum]GIJ71644.1 NAD(P) transhydrogenase subunit alpha [Virgisporangium ochraceum]
MAPLTVGVVRERAAGERRVALVPGDLARLTRVAARGGAPPVVLVEADAGRAARHDNAAYAAAGADVVTADELDARADLVLAVGRPAPHRLRTGQVVVGMLAGRSGDGYVADLAGLGVTAVSLDLVPRTLSRAQEMDALTSQATVAGYRAVILAANAFERYFPMLVTAAGTAKPAEVLVLGAGVAGLAAIGTARRLGAVVRAYDVRAAAREEAASVGAEVIVPGVLADATGAGGYARELTADEQRAATAELAARVVRHDVVIATAQVPGRRPPLLVDEETVKAMAPGSVLVDLASGPLGGNVALSVPDRTVVTDNGVTVIGAGNLPSSMAAAASAAYSRNVVALLGHLLRDGELAFDPTDEIHASVVATRNGEVRS